MQGCRPLTADEIQALSGAFEGEFAVRDAAFFKLGVKSGFRVSELLSLRVKDVWLFGRVVDRVTVARRNRKGKPASHTVALGDEARLALAGWLWVMTERFGDLEGSWYLFKSRKGANRAITRRQALRILRRAYDRNELTGPLGTHSMRKSYSLAAFKKSGNNVLMVQRLLGHARCTTTQRYLPVDQAELDELARAI